MAERGKGAWRWWHYAAVTLALAAVIGVILLAVRQHQPTSEDNSSASASDAARALVVAMTSFSQATLPQDIQGVLDRATGDFKSQFEQQRHSFVDAVKGAHVSATGTVSELGVVSSSADRVVVIVAAASDISKAKGKDKHVTRNYRMKLTMDRSGGSWLASGMELVP